MWAQLRRRVIRGIALGIAGVALAVLTNAQPAAAHAVLVTSDPANGATVAAAPGSVRLWFSEEISAQLSGARLVDHDGNAVAGSQAVAARGDPRLLELALPHLAHGTYGVLWRVLAEDDGHTTNGVVLFNVGAANGPSAVTAANASTTASPIDVGRRWLGIAALAGLIGGFAVAQLVLGRARAGGPANPVLSAIRLARRRLLAFAAGCATVAVLVGCADLIAEARDTAAPGRSVSALVGDVLSSTRWGHLWIAREAALIVLIPVLVRLRAVERSQVRPARSLASVAAGLVLVRVLLEALGSHAAAVTSGRGTAIAADAIHILAACLWLGSLAALVLILWPHPVDGVSRVDIIRACGGSFARLVSVSVAVILLTGLYSAGREIGSVDSLFTTAYGRALLAKSALLVVLGGVGVVNASRLRETPLPRFGSAGQPVGSRTPTRRLVLLETGIGAILLIAVAVLVESAPPRGPAPDAVASEPQARSGAMDDLVVTVSATPNQPGPNAFTVIVASSRRPPPAAIDELALTITQDGIASVVPLRQVEPGRYFGTGPLAGSEDPQIAAIIHRSGRTLAVTLAWQLAVSSDATPAPAHRLAPIVNGLALALLVAIGAAGIAWAWCRRSAPTSRAFHAEPPEATERVLEHQP
ncbi:MAG: copper transport protein [Pseudonocardiales bacterium]|nr:copper transport protein [Pseudonocardiales bacterium]